jgi:ABC-type nitrate/sulfonate/bicarbonate transport system permease component
MSLYRVAWGFLLAAAVAVPLGLAMGWSPRLRRLFSPVVELLRPVPPLAWIPISILWFGIGVRSAAFIIFLGAVFPILLNTVAGVLAVSPALVEAARTLGAREGQLLRKVLLPGALPSIFVGLRVGLGIGWMTLVAAEFTGVKSGYGLGYMIMTARDIQRPDEIIAGMVVIGVTGLLIDLLIRLAEARLLPWR